MRIGIDSYCWHRFFGEVYAGIETDPGRRMDLPEAIARAAAFGAEGVSLESFMLEDAAPGTLAALRGALDAAGLDRVWAWGHPNGLGSGTRPEALEDLRRHVDVARALGARVMRICAGGRRTRTLPWAEHRALLLPLLARAADHAAREGVVLAIENHIDLTAAELRELLTTLDHPALGVCLDTGNTLRMLEDPLAVTDALAPFVRATHVKDVAAHRGSPRDFAFWPSVPLGRGLIDLPAVLARLRAAGFDGLLALEIDYLHPAWPDLDAAIAESLAHLRGLRAGAAA